MTGYTSGKTTHDPMPYVNGYGSRLDTEAVYLGGLRLGNTYAPRPEYDNHNPILVLTRRVWPGPLSDGAEGILGWRDGVSTGPNYTPEHITHARRVLTKLAALTTTPNGVTD